MSDAETSANRSEADDWKTRHARVRPRADEAAEKRRCEFPESRDDDWALRHAETKRRT